MSEAVMTAEPAAAVASFKNQCAALGVKANSRIVKHEASLLDHERLDFSLNYIGGAGLQGMIDSIVHNHKLETLVLANNGLSNESVVHLCRAVASHPTLKVIDLSNNQISLPAGLAIVELARKNRVLTDVKLQNTLIDEAVQRKIRRSLNLHHTKSGAVAAAAAAAAAGVETPYQKALAEHKAAQEKKRRAIEAAAAEGRGADGLPTAFVPELKGHGVVGPARADDGWAVLQVFISSTPHDFVSELALLHDEIIPSLNEKYAARKVHLLPMSFYHEVPPLSKAKAKAAPPRTAVAFDHLQALARSAPFVVTLVGDKRGLPEFVPMVPSGDKGRVAEPTTAAEPVQVREVTAVAARKGLLHLPCLRARSLTLGVPEGLCAAVTDDPHLVHPDETSQLIKAATANAQGVKLSAAIFDPEAERAGWRAHTAFRTATREGVPASFAVSYRAQYATVDGAGQVRLTGLDEFRRAVTARLDAALDTLYPAVEPTVNLLPSPLLIGAIKQALLARHHDTMVGRKNVSGKLDLYCVTPPSRNMVLLTALPGQGATQTLAAFVQRNAAKPSYVMASYFARHPLLNSEPSDPRSVFLDLSRQLLRDQALPSHIEHEVDVVKVKRFFSQTLANTSGDVGDDKTVVIAVDGLDDIDPLVVPCLNLRRTDGGADAWDPPASNVTIQKPLPATATKVVESFDWIPICLSRNVRFVGTCLKGSETHHTLELREHDSCDPLPLGDIGDGDVETVLAKECERHSVASLRDDEVAVVRGKPEARNLDYLAFVVDSLRQRDELPQYLTRLTALTHLPGTVKELSGVLLKNLEQELGEAFVRTAISQLLCARWGLLECELRELLRRQAAQQAATGKAAAGAGADAGKATPLLNGELFQRLARRLRPVLEDFLPTLQGSGHPVNALHCRLHIRCRTFRSVAAARYLTPETRKRTHHQLAHFYKKHMSTNGPLEARACKEFPYHVVQGGMWETFESTVVSLAFVSQVYLLGLGYGCLRELIRAYNTLDELKEPPEGLTKDAFEALKLKTREYTYFVRDHNVNLVQYPHMVRQIAITCNAESCLHQDAKRYFKTLDKYPHFEPTNKSRGKLHRDKVNACVFAPTGMRFATCSDDRSVRICNLNAEPILPAVQQSVSKVQRLAYSGTSRYLAASCEDRSLFVIDATGGGIVAKLVGPNASIRCLALSARGRFVFCGSEDRNLNVWESETGRHLFTVSHAKYSHHTSPYGAVVKVVPHPMKEDEFFTISEKKLFGWRVRDAALDAYDETLVINAHNTLPLANFHVVCDATFVVTTARDVQPMSPRAEDNVKVFSINTGRCVATLNLGIADPSAPGPVDSCVSPNEQVLAAALSDGGMCLFRTEWRSFAPEESSRGESKPTIVTPYRYITAFRGHPTPTLTAMCFSFDSACIAAVGNQRQLKVWSSSEIPAHADVPLVGGSVATGSLLTALSAADHTIAEFLMDQPATCLDWTPNPVEGGGELIVGDTVGKIHALRLFR